MLGLAAGDAEGRGSAAALLRVLASDGDSAELLLVFADVVLQGVEQALGMLGGEDDAALHLGLGEAGEGGNEVGNELRLGVSQNNEVGVHATGYFGAKLYLELVFFGIVVSHNL